MGGGTLDWEARNGRGGLGRGHVGLGGRTWKGKIGRGHGRRTMAVGGETWEG